MLLAVALALALGASSPVAAQDVAPPASLGRAKSGRAFGGPTPAASATPPGPSEPGQVGGAAVDAGHGAGVFPDPVVTCSQELSRKVRQILKDVCDARRFSLPRRFPHFRVRCCVLRSV